MDILKGDKPVATRSITFSGSFLRSSEVETLVARLNLLAAPPRASNPDELCQAVDDAASQWKIVAKEAEAQQPSCDVAPKHSGCESLEDAESKVDLLRIRNTANILAEVDYEHPYYLNSRTPWIGNAQVDAKLNADGTLTEGSAQATDQTWSTILSTAGSLAGSFATFASAAATANPSLLKMTVAGCQPSSGWPLPSTEAVYRITVSTEIYFHDHVQEDAGIGASCKPFEEGVTEGSFTVTKEDGSSGKEDSNVIKLSGQVMLPKGSADNK
jgi:hypothetical protein